MLMLQFLSHNSLANAHLTADPRECVLPQPVEEGLLDPLAVVTLLGDEAFVDHPYMEGEKHVPGFEVPADLSSLEELGAAGLVHAGLVQGLTLSNSHGLSGSEPKEGGYWRRKVAPVKNGVEG